VKRIDAYWWDRNGVAVSLLPLSWLFCGVVWLRRLAYRIGVFKTARISIPIIVVGNISVGGTGKTPLVLWLVDYLRDMGFNPGIVSRGYGGQARNWPQQVRPDSDPAAVGDEPLLLSQRTGCPISVGSDRAAAARALQEHTECDIIISDDGLQHYAMGRDIEIAVVDGDRGLGNGFCIPAGPLRERISRLEHVDMVVANGSAGRGKFIMMLKQGDVYNLADPTRVAKLKDFADLDAVHAVAGIGNPERFFRQLELAGLTLQRHAFPDHYRFTPEDFEEMGSEMVIMTEKDAVKCVRFASPQHWVVRVNAELPENFEQRLGVLIRGLSSRNG